MAKGILGERGFSGVYEGGESGVISGPRACGKRLGILPFYRLQPGQKRWFGSKGSQNTQLFDTWKRPACGRD